MRRYLVAGNWKMNGSRAQASALLSQISEGVATLDSIDVLVCPPFVLLADAQQALQSAAVGLGAQNVSEREAGAYTGEVSAAMLLEFGCRYVIVGHSERRSLFGESSELVAAKYMQALGAGLIPILCVGETLEERERGVTDQVVQEQLDAVLDQEGPQALAGGVVAYEPVWAIGTGRTATPEQAQEVHAMIRARVGTHSETVAQELRILYGGSVKGSNAKALFGMADIDGGLVGGASLDGNDFVAICRSAAEVAA